jgi:hypothetical protein
MDADGKQKALGFHLRQGYGGQVGLWALGKAKKREFDRKFHGSRGFVKNKDM